MQLLKELAYPLIQAPMAGGPANSALAIQIIENGGIGFLAAGYKTPETVETEISHIVHSKAENCGINIFVPDKDPHDAQQKVSEYQAKLIPLAQELEIDISDIPAYTDDYFWEKIELIERSPIPLVSFTFGLPPTEVITRLKKHDKILCATVTSPHEAFAAQEQGFDLICLQSFVAGGHRGTFEQNITSPPFSTTELLQFARTELKKPYIIAGGIANYADIQQALSLGASAVQLGTAFLLAHEAGTKPAHRTAIQEFHSRKTVITRAYSGREARGIENAFTKKFNAYAPATYPRINTLTQKIRQAGAHNPEIINLWAGIHFTQAKNLAAKDIIKDLFTEA